MWLPVNHIKPRNTLYWNKTIETVGNYKSASKQLQNSGQLQNNTVNGAMLITINPVIELQFPLIPFLISVWFNFFAEGCQNFSENEPNLTEKRFKYAFKVQVLSLCHCMSI